MKLHWDMNLNIILSELSLLVEIQTQCTSWHQWWTERQRWLIMEAKENTGVILSVWGNSHWHERPVTSHSVHSPKEISKNLVHERWIWRAGSCFLGGLRPSLPRPVWCLGLSSGEFQSPSVDRAGLGVLQSLRRADRQTALHPCPPYLEFQLFSYLPLAIPSRAWSALATGTRSCAFIKFDPHQDCIWWFSKLWLPRQAFAEAVFIALLRISGKTAPCFLDKPIPLLFSTPTSPQKKKKDVFPESLDI